MTKIDWETRWKNNDPYWALDRSVGNELSDLGEYRRHVRMLLDERDELKRALDSCIIPSGWKLVPVEPTSEMLDVFSVTDARGLFSPYQLWKKMLAATPTIKTGVR